MKMESSLDSRGDEVLSCVWALYGNHNLSPFRSPPVQSIQVAPNMKPDPNVLVQAGAIGVLEHAIEYLVTEQMVRDRIPVCATREAIAVLCIALAEIARAERSSPRRKSLLEWLKIRFALP